MPQRPRSHQLEDNSIVHFKSLLPDNFLCREKEKDYGVDLEVELFDENDSATGYMFNVQIKATDSEENAQAVSIEIDRLNYLASLDLPAIVVRYCQETKSVYWKWVFNINKRQALHQKKLKVVFENDDLWQYDTPEKLSKTLNILRLLKLGYSHQKFHILWNSSLPYKDKLTCYSAKASLENLNFIHKITESKSSIPIELFFDSNNLILRIDCIMSNTFKIEKIEQHEIESNILYGIAVLLASADFAEHAKQTAKYCLKNSIKTYAKEFASITSAALFPDSKSAFQLALLNELHFEQDVAFGTFFTKTFESHPVNLHEFNLFLCKAIKHQKSKGIDVSSLQYSFGSNLRVLGERAKAVAAYNSARKSSNNYLKRDYFWRELGGMLFMQRHYSWSALAYEHANNINASDEHKFGLADALLHACKYSTAKEKFYEISGEATSIGAEARLKIILCDWLETNTQNIKPLDDQKLIELVEHGLSENRPETVFPAQLALAFCYEDDEFIWANMLSLAFTQAINDYALDIVAMSVLRCGMQPYTLFRGNISDMENKHSELLQNMDQVVFDLNEDAELIRNKPKQIRVLGANPLEDIVLELDS